MRKILADHIRLEPTTSVITGQRDANGNISIGLHKRYHSLWYISIQYKFSLSRRTQPKLDRIFK